MSQTTLSRKKAEKLMQNQGFKHNPGYRCFSKCFMYYFFTTQEDRKGYKFTPRKNFLTLVKQKKSQFGLN